MSGASFPNTTKRGTSLSRATDPEATVWVSANAGSGKTYVLSRRVIRLLLEGAKPSELLCLTFTKVAAAEMSNKVFEILGDWSQLDDVALGKAIGELTGKTAIRVQLDRARHLFATALDTPGGLRIQTIHAFCEALLHQFPLEANIPGHFEMMDETDQALLLDEARRRVILAGLGVGGMAGADTSMAARLAEAYTIIQVHASDGGIDEAISQLIQSRDAFTQWVEEGGGSVSDAFAPAWEGFGLSLNTTSHDLYGEFVGQTAYSEGELDLLVSALRDNGKKTADEILSLIAVMQQTANPEQAHKARCQIFLTKKLEPRKALVSDKFMEDNGLKPYFMAEQDILLEQLDRLRTLEVLRASQALFEIAWEMLSEYGNLKQRRGLLDFTDLISKTANLLSRSEIAGWIQYKLDAGIRHVLVDEAQDTSPVQWDIISKITEEFYAGAGARAAIRTLFVVGDEKQSIYSFQGADPEEFERQFRQILRKAHDAGLETDKVPLTTSYRSVDDVLSAVDKVFSLSGLNRGLSEADTGILHTANRQDEPGDVLIWPLEEKEAGQAKENWNDPVDKTGEQAAERRLADRIAETIHQWITNGETLPAREAPIREGDILILVRKRDRFVKAMNLALKAKGLNSAGADRLKLTEYIAVEDMIALGRFATNPMDDLSLAGLLKSPLFGFDENQLMGVAMDRDEKSLFESIHTLGETDATLAETAKVLAGFTDAAQRYPVHEFYARIFSKHRLRAKYLERLGYEVEDILDGFFQTLIAYDDNGGLGGGLGLLGFVEWLSGANPELKREIELDSNEVRVITAHSSKGLEKPIVFLVDPGSKAFDTRFAPKIVWLPQEGGGLLPIWQSKTAWRIKASEGVFDTITEKAEDEYRRLLYVGMTRAADRLIICGYGKEDAGHDHWHKMVMRGLSAHGGDERIKGRFSEHVDGEGNLSHWKWQVERQITRKRKAEAVASIQVNGDEAPGWFSPAKSEKPVPRPLNPSGVLSMLEIEAEPETGYRSEDQSALLKGNLTHQLLQALPDLSEEARQHFAGDWLDRQDKSLTPDLRTEILDSVSRVLEAPELAGLFAENSIAEAEIVGTIEVAGIERKVHGKIDRLVVEGNRVIIADYKTNRHVPDRPEAVSSQYLSQMALYRQLLGSVYPQHRIEAVLVWTQDGSAMMLPGELLDACMDRLKLA